MSVVDENLVLKMKELVNKAVTQNEILPKSEAFQNFPVEDEVHEGKIEYWTLKESKDEV